MEEQSLYSLGSRACFPKIKALLYGKPNGSQFVMFNVVNAVSDVAVCLFLNTTRRLSLPC